MVTEKMKHNVDYVFIDKKSGNLGVIKRSAGNWYLVSCGSSDYYDYGFVNIKHHKNAPSTFEIVTKNCECLGEL